MATAIIVAPDRREQAPSVKAPHPAAALSAEQLAAFYPDFATVRQYIAEHAEAITLAGKRKRAQRHSPTDRFAAWRLRLCIANLARLYEPLPLLRGLDGAL